MPGLEIISLVYGNIKNTYVFFNRFMSQLTARSRAGNINKEEFE